MRTSRLKKICFGAASKDRLPSHSSQYGRYGYRRITIKLQEAGWNVGKDRVERIWRREGLKVPQRQKPRGRLWLNDGSCVICVTLCLHLMKE